MFTKIFFGASLLILNGLFANVAFAGDGEAGDGRNGPQVAGNAIPVHLDRAIEVKDLAIVTNICNGKTLKKLYLQVFKTLNSSYVSESPQRGETPSYIVTENLPWYGKQKALEAVSRITNVGETSFIQINNSSLNMYSQMIIRKQHTHYSASLVEANGTLTKFRDYSVRENLLPIFTFDYMTNEVSYGELGELTDEHHVVVNLKISLPSTGLQRKNQFINTQTNAPVKGLEINVEEHAQCMLSELQSLKKD